MEQTIKEVRKKSELHAENSFDYEKLVYQRGYSLEASYTEELEEITFVYQIQGMTCSTELKKEERRNRYQFLINFEKLLPLLREYKISLEPENIYYDENFLPYIKNRDLYGRGESFDEKDFLEIYRAYVGGILGNKYEVAQLLESGTELLRKEPSFVPYYQAETCEDLVKELRERKNQYLSEQQKQQVSVSKTGNRLRFILSIVAPVVAVIFLALFLYYRFGVVPKQEKEIAAYEAYIVKEYADSIDYLENISPEELDIHTKYMLAVSYAKSESLKKEELDILVSKLSINTNEVELDYWIYLGRMDMAKAEDLAQALSDDKLLIYAYMKELDQLASNTTINGSDKQSRIATLESNIQSLGQKYEIETSEEATVEEIPVEETTMEEVPVEEIPVEETTFEVPMTEAPQFEDITVEEATGNGGE